VYLKGVVLLNHDEVGVFYIDQEEKISITFNKGSAGVEETLEFAAEQGLNFGLQLKPEYEAND
jgi:hypothetical protein